MTYYERLISMLPHKLQEPDNAINFKKLLKVFSGFLEEDMNKSKKYSLLLSIYDLEGDELDLLADMFYMYRLDGETDEEFRLRIVQQIVVKKSKNTLPAIQAMINQLMTTGKIYIKENHNNEPANVFLTGYAQTEQYDFIYEVIVNIIPAGVRLILPIVRLDTWQVVKDSADTWGEIYDSRFIW